MVTKSEKIAYDNLLAKNAKLRAKNDMLEQESIELKKEIKEVKNENIQLRTNNEKLADISTRRCNELYDEIAKINEKRSEEKEEYNTQSSRESFSLK